MANVGSQCDLSLKIPGRTQLDPERDKPVNHWESWELHLWEDFHTGSSLHNTASCFKIKAPWPLILVHLVVGWNRLFFDLLSTLAERFMKIC